MTSKLTAFLVCFVFVTTVFSQSINIDFSSDKTIIEAGDPSVITLNVNTPGEITFILPAEFEQLNAGRKSGQIFDNKLGKIVPSYSFLQRGVVAQEEYVIKATYKVNGKKYKAEPIVITVVKRNNDNRANVPTSSEGRETVL